jgi:3-isopropylmalate/(R)-2-methylmalate dehydratase small subunit
MEPLTPFQSHVVPLCRDDVDTDQIIPARFLKVTDKVGLGERLFADWRYDESGAPRADFVLNKPEHQGAQVLLARENFGCGSSREHAPWALVDWGLRAIVAVSFADIFRNNALKNGLLPIAVDEASYARLRDAVAADAGAEVKVDLASQTLSLPDGKAVEFPVDAFAKKCLLSGMDQLGYLLSFAESIDRFEAERGESGAS